MLQIGQKSTSTAELRQRIQSALRRGATSSLRRLERRIVNPLTELVVSVRLGSAFGRTRVSRTDGSVADFHPLARSSGRKPTEIVDSTHDPRVPTLLQRTETGPSTHNHWPHMPPGTAQPSTRSSITHRNHTRRLSVHAPVTAITTCRRHPNPIHQAAGTV